jgi:hypothetical protein
MQLGLQKEKRLGHSTFLAYCSVTQIGFEDAILFFMSWHSLGKLFLLSKRLILYFLDELLFLYDPTQT